MEGKEPPGRLPQRAGTPGPVRAALPGPARLGLGGGDASRGALSPPLVVTNSGPRGTRRLRPRETGEETVGAGRVVEGGREQGPGRPLVFTFT